MLRDFGTKRLWTIGYSAGGLGAIRYGVELGADRALSFAGMTNVGHDAPDRFEYGLALVRKRLEARLSAEILDLKLFLTSRQYATKIELFYGAEMPRDKAWALHLAGAGNVTLRSIEGLNDHEILRWLALNCDLRGLLSAALAKG
jgi:hypothetical protein